MRTVQTDADRLAQEIVPEVAVANNVERHSLHTMYAMRGHSLSEDDKYWADAQKKLEDVKKYLADAKALGASSERLAKLKTAAEEAEKAALHYEELAKQADATIKSIVVDREKLNAAAKEYIETCNGFLADQNERLRNEIDGKIDAVPTSNNSESHMEAPAPAAEPAPITPLACPEGDAALQHLKVGNARYTAGTTQHPDATQGRRADTAANGQHPFATVVAC